MWRPLCEELFIHWVDLNRASTESWNSFINTFEMLTNKQTFSLLSIFMFLVGNLNLWVTSQLDASNVSAAIFQWLLAKCLSWLVCLWRQEALNTELWSCLFTIGPYRSLLAGISSPRSQGRAASYPVLVEELLPGSPSLPPPHSTMEWVGGKGTEPTLHMPCNVTSGAD